MKWYFYLLLGILITILVVLIILIFVGIFCKCPAPAIVPSNQPSLCPEDESCNDFLLQNTPFDNKYLKTYKNDYIESRPDGEVDNRFILTKERGNPWVYYSNGYLTQNGCFLSYYFENEDEIRPSILFFDCLKPRGTWLSDGKSIFFKTKAGNYGLLSYFEAPNYDIKNPQLFLLPISKYQIDRGDYKQSVTVTSE